YHVILSLLFFFFFFFNDTATTEIYTLSLHDALPISYLSRKALEEIGFRSIGENVKVSDKASIYNPECISIGDHSRIDDFCIISGDRKSTRLNSSHVKISYAVFCLKKKKKKISTQVNK